MSSGERKITVERENAQNTKETLTRTKKKRETRPKTKQENNNNNGTKLWCLVCVLFLSSFYISGRHSGECTTQGQRETELVVVVHARSSSHE